MASIESIARVLGINIKDVERRALRALIYEELRSIRAEKILILTRYGVREFSELWRKVEEGTIDDTMAHDDIVRLDYLEHWEKELERILKELEEK